ncbi:ImuA family protein [Leisingera sp. S232]|uniref:ImuA family protein n=1 Tax=Leisingera sp. S232 TaxID=3415132 RepID=UPI003C79C402
MPTHLLSRHSRKPRPVLSLTQGIGLELGRVHEACGPARLRFALWLAAIAPGPVLWLSSLQIGTPPAADGIAGCASPSRFLFVQTTRTEDLLWAMEEALRSGAAALVVADMADPPAMTPVRRLHLAAERGGRFGPAPLGLLLTSGQGGAQGIESRWHLAPAHHLPVHEAPSGGSAARMRAPSFLPGCWRLQRLRARTLPPRSWQISQDAADAPLRAVPAAGPASAAASGPSASGALPQPQAPLAMPARP